MYLQTRRDAEAAKRFFRRLLRSHGTGRYANNRAELSHQPTRVRQRGMRRFSSSGQAPRFLSAHAAVYSLFNLQRQLVSAMFYRFRQTRAFECWNEAVAA